MKALIKPSKRDWRSTWKQLTQLCFTYIDTRLHFAQTSLRIMIGTIVYMHTSLLIIGDPQINSSTCPRNARIIFKKQVLVARTTANFLILLLKDSITPFSIRQILVNLLGKREKAVLKENSAHSSIMNLNWDIYLLVISLYCLRSLKSRARDRMYITLMISN